MTTLSTLGEKYTIVCIADFTLYECQHQLIDVMYAIKQQNIDDILLILAGKPLDQKYVDFLHAHVALMQLQEEVLILCDTSSSLEDALYRRADLYISLSQTNSSDGQTHRAIFSSIPTLFYAQASFPFKAPTRIAQEIIHLLQDAPKRTLLAHRQHQNLHLLLPDIRLDGPCESSYSLALVNRELGRACLHLGKKTVFFATEGGGDYPAHKELLQGDEILSYLADSPPNAHLVTRNLYPPRVSSMGGIVKILGPYGWEESLFPAEYVRHFNRRLSGLACMSSYVEGVMRANGVKVPLCVTGIGVDHILQHDFEPLPLTLPEGLKLLHISSCFPRKGVDILIKVLERIPLPLTLIVKTFPNPHNNLKEELLALQWNQTQPHFFTKTDKTILIIEEEFTTGEIKSLYKACDILVAPSRGEGFGLPMAEAMLLELPVVTTGYGGQTDFCTQETAWLIDYTLEQAKTHISTPNSIWAQPSEDDLLHQIMTILNAPPHTISNKLQKAKQTILTHYTWKSVAKKLLEFQERLLKL